MQCKAMDGSSHKYLSFHMEKREAYNAYNYGRATFVDPPLIGEKAENNLFGKFFTIYEQKDPHHVIIPGLIAANVQGGYLPPYDCAFTAMSTKNLLVACRHVIH